MSFNKLHSSAKTASYFIPLKTRTSLTPNILCRMALCLSIADPSIPNSKLDDEKGQEFSRYTLLGEWDAFFIALLRERLIHDGLDPEKDLMNQFKAHLNRGVSMLFSRMKSLDDVYELVESAQKAHNNHNNHNDSTNSNKYDLKKKQQKKISSSKEVYNGSN